MEALVLIKEVGAYSERQYQRQDGTTEYLSMPLSSATRSSTRTSLTWPRASGSIAHGRIRTARRDMRMRSILLICRVFNNGLNEFVCLVIRRVL